MASLDPPEQDRFLRAAIEKKLGVHELRAAIRAFKLIQAPEPKIDWQEPEPPEGGSALKYTKEHEESEEDDGLSTKHPSLESDFAIC